MNSFQEFNDLIATYNGVILYTPLPDEIDYTQSLFPIDLPPNQIVLPVNKKEDPFIWANKCTEYFKKGIPYVLVPGTRFDIYGTRHGRGEGWYDRFLSKVPTAWLKVGITDAPRLSLEQLPRQAWDQPVDFIIAYSKNSWDIYKTISRPPPSSGRFQR